MSPIFFTCRIKPGTPIFHDHGFFRWPSCKAPGGGSEAADPAMTFIAEIFPGGFSLYADGYGNRSPHYGNGCILVRALDSLEIDEADRGRVVDYLVAKKEAECGRAMDNLEERRAELASLRALRGEQS